MSVPATIRLRKSHGFQSQGNQINKIAFIPELLPIFIIKCTIVSINTIEYQKTILEDNIQSRKNYAEYAEDIAGEKEHTGAKKTGWRG